MSDSDEAVGQVVDVADLVADDIDADPEALLTSALSKVRKRGEQACQ